MGKCIGGFFNIGYTTSLGEGKLLIQNQIYIFTNPSAWAGYDTRSIFKRSFNRFEFRVASPRLKKLVCPTIYL